MKILDLKKKDDEKAKPSKQILITGAVIIAAMIITIIIIYFLILPGYKKKIVDDVLYGDISDDVVTETTTEVDNVYTAAEMKDEISKYVANYFTTTNVEEYLSDENVEQLADLIIKSLKDAGLLEQKDNSDEIRQSIMNQLKELLEQNNLTGENVWVLDICCNEMNFGVCINQKDLVGEPQVGRRFKGIVWMQGSIKYRE